MIILALTSSSLLTRINPYIVTTTFIYDISHNSSIRIASDYYSCNSDPVLANRVIRRILSVFIKSSCCMINAGKRALSVLTQNRRVTCLVQTRDNLLIVDAPTRSYHCRQCLSNDNKTIDMISLISLRDPLRSGLIVVLANRD